MFNCLFCNSVNEPVYIVYKLKQKNVDVIIEETTMKKLKSRLNYLESSNFVENKITYDKDQNIALGKFYKL